MVAIVFATSMFSMATTGVAIFRRKADLERPISIVGSEGMMITTVCKKLFFFFFFFFFHFRKKGTEIVRNTDLSILKK